MSMTTWLKAGPAGMGVAQRGQWRETVEQVVANLDRYFPDDQAEYLAQAGGDSAFSFWLRLVDEQLDMLPSRDVGRRTFPWRQAYQAGWSPLEAACTACSGLDDRPNVVEPVEVPFHESSTVWGGPHV